MSLNDMSTSKRRATDAGSGAEVGLSEIESSPDEVGSESTEDAPEERAIERARELVERGEIETAQAIYREIILDAPEDIEARVGLAELHRALDSRSRHSNNWRPPRRSIRRTLSS